MGDSEWRRRVTIGFRMRRAEKKAEAGVGRGGAFGEAESWSEMEVVRCPEHGRRSGSEGPRGLPA